MSTQAEKYNLSIAGEFFVAAQLQRLGARASVTYGNAKNADVVAVGQASNKSLVVEVKSSSAGRWPVGSRVPSPSDQVWVFVHLPRDTSAPPEYFVLTQRQLHEALAPAEREYMARYKEKHGRNYGDKPGVAAATTMLLAPYRNAWSTILSML